MAAALLLSVDSPGPTFPVGAGAAGAPGNGVGAAGVTSWNRSLDRALEEAAANGYLNLSGRKLKEFPKSASNHDLTDTTRADLSRNRLPELPVEMCMLVSLESLNLYQNCLRSLPESLVNLQALTHLNISRNQLSTLPGPICSLPLKVLIACNNKLLSLPEELGQLRQLTELDVSCNEIQVLPPQIGQLETLRDLNIRRNHLVRLPPELAELPLVRLDLSCNKVTTIPVCYRNLRHLQSIVLDNNPLQSPPAQICIKGKIHIFKYLNMEACKTAPELPEYERRTLPFGSCAEEIFSGRPYGALDSGFNSVDSGYRRWSGNEPAEELADLPLRVAEITKQQRHRREREREEGRCGPPVTNGSLESELEQIDYIDSCGGEEEEPGHRGSLSLSSQFMAYIERRITRETGACDAAASGVTVERVRREAQLAAQRYEEERHKRCAQREAPLSYAKHKAALSPSKSSPTDYENMCPSRRSTHTDDSALFVLGEDRSPLSPPAYQSSSYAGPVTSPSHRGPLAPPPHRGPTSRPESFLFRLSQREERRRDQGAPHSLEPVPQSPSGPVGEELESVEQLRKNIETRLKVSLPSDLGAALTDGVVLCHLANHVRPRSVPSIHVPSPAVPKLTMAKCRRNVENFLEACRRMGVPQEHLCSVGDVLGARGLGVYATVKALLSLGPPLRSAPPAHLAGFALFYLSVMSVLCALYCHLLPCL
ncbi:DISP complex protein LRCH3 [Paramormyrops kingsleyae]